MNTPILLAVLALFTSGIAGFAGKVAAANRAYAPSFILVQTMGVGLFALAMHFIQRHPLDLSPKMTTLAALAGTLAGITIVSVLTAFQLGGEGSVIFPIYGLGVTVQVILSLLVYHEPVTTTKLLGFAFGITSIVFLSR